jgi:preprotein translocase SecE subunit
MAHVTRIKAGDKKSGDEPKKTSTSKNVKAAVKLAKTIVKEEKQAIKKEKSVKLKKEKKPMNKFVRVITAPFRYVHNSWLEIRQVRWPNRKATWKLVGAIFIYSAFFIILVTILDALFNFIFSKIIG